MLQNDLYQYLTTADGIASLFPGGVHHMSIPQDVNEWPAMAFQLISEFEFAEDMEAPNDAKLDQANYQFTITANQSALATAAADAFHAIFRNFRGTMGATRVQAISVGNVNHLEERRGDKLRRAVVLDYSINFDV